MGWQIIKQPNGLYCIFSSIVDDVIYFNGSRQQIINAFIHDSTKDIVKRCNEVMNELDTGEKPYAQFTKSFDEMIETVKVNYGIKHANRHIEKMKE